MNLIRINHCRGIVVLEHLCDLFTKIGWINIEAVKILPKLFAHSIKLISLPSVGGFILLLLVVSFLQKLHSLHVLIWVVNSGHCINACDYSQGVRF